jgi:hypothetical protein
VGLRNEPLDAQRGSEISKVKFWKKKYKNINLN